MPEPSTPLELLAAAPGAPPPLEALRRIGTQGGVLGLAPAQGHADLWQAVGHGPRDWLGLAPAVVVGSGGSLGRRRWCLQPLTHLEASARATGTWLQELGIDPSRALVVNPLPWHHVSGLMPWLRSECWGAEHQWLPPAQLRRLEELPLPSLSDRAAVLSLVPTQLHRLLAQPAGVRWLREFAVIWVGGAPLAEAEAVRSRELGLRLAPCYGSTETGSMVAALAPEAFLEGQAGCGHPLSHAQLRITPGEGPLSGALPGAIEVRASSLSPGHLEGGRLRPLQRDGEGWWRTGDGGQLGPGGLTLLGRLDGAVHCGGETVFPEQVEQTLQTLASQRDLPLAALLLVAQPDPEWGQQLVALVRGKGTAGEGLILALQALAAGLPPAQRPRAWRLCPELAPNPMGKWERQHWQHWLATHHQPSGQG
jgi:O-succinylbenzoic acid--CoA ligase